MGKKDVRIEVLDTNVLIRFLIGDVPEQKFQAAVWFQEARKQKRSILVLPIVIAEASYVLESFYKNDRREIAESLETFVSQRWLRVESRRELLALWIWYRGGMHFVDSFLLAWSHMHKATVLSFDQKILRKN